MKKLFWYILACTILVLGAWVPSLLAATVVKLRPKLEAQNLARILRPISGESTRITITGTSANTGPFVTGACFTFVCDTTVYFEFGDAAAPTADGNSNYLPSDTMLTFVTDTRLSLHLAAIRVRGNGTCYLTRWE